jgi:UDP-N-acetylmuramate--alanine ligase
MKVYFSGISGTGIGPLAEFAQDAGFEVIGSDLQRGAIASELDERAIPVHYGEQDGSFLREAAAVDWLVYTSALPDNHPELLAAHELGIKATKRDEFIAELVHQKNLKMIGVAGTHGKTTTTSMIIWACLKLGIPVNYLVGTTLGWAKSGHFSTDAEYFVYEADEYDRNFLAYHPEIAVITCVDYDHPDIYPTREEYQAAFKQYESQSKNVVKNTTIDPRLTLVGELRREDASIALRVLKMISDFSEEEICKVLNDFPGVGRRFERIAKGIYSDYGHHPEEIKATIKMAEELKQRDGHAGLAVIYQPHQNTRQHEVRHLYHDAFIGADKIFWLPTYLTREDPNLETLSAKELSDELENKDVVECADINDELTQKVRDLQTKNWLIVLITAGPADNWLRENFAN